jgi:hypothetical protein
MIPVVLVCSGYCHEIPESEYFTNNRNLFLIVQSLENWKSRHQQIPFLVRTFFLLDGYLLVSSHARRGRGLSEISFITALSPFMRTLPTVPNHLLKAPSLIITLGMGFQHLSSDHRTHCTSFAFLVCQDVFHHFSALNTWVFLFPWLDSDFYNSR